MLDNEEEKHGGESVNHIKETMIKEGLKKYAMELVIPNPMFIYKTLCVFCIKRESLTQKNYILPKVQQKGSFGGNCYFVRHKKIYQQ